MKNKRVLIFLIILVFLVTSFIFIKNHYVGNLKADSGFDYSYDSGSSYNSGSSGSFDFDLGSSQDRDYSSDQKSNYDNYYQHSSSSPSSTSSTIIIYFLIIVMAMLIFAFIIFIIDRLKSLVKYIKEEVYFRKNISKIDMDSVLSESDKLKKSLLNY